jgi:hypothetical protein
MIDVPSNCLLSANRLFRFSLNSDSSVAAVHERSLSTRPTN